MGLPPGLGGGKSGLRALREFWLNLQLAYELRLVEQAAGPQIEALPVMPDSKATPQQPSMLRAISGH